MDYDGYESSIPPERSEGEDHEAYQARWKALRKFTYGEPDWDDFDDKDEFEDAYQAWKRRRTMKLPEPREFQTPQQRLWSKKNRERPGIPKESPDYYADEETMDLRSDFGKLQIIVKLTTIHLTIEKPYYGGGSWHVEGQANEAMSVILILATFCTLSPDMHADVQQLSTTSTRPTYPKVFWPFVKK